MARDCIATIPIGPSDDVRIGLESRHGRELIDIRAYADSRAGPTMARAPTKQGVTLALDRLPDLLRALNAARAEAERRGLI